MDFISGLDQRTSLVGRDRPREDREGSPSRTHPLHVVYRLLIASHAGAATVLQRRKTNMSASGIRLMSMRRQYFCRKYMMSRACVSF